MLLVILSLGRANRLGLLKLPRFVVYNNGKRYVSFYFVGWIVRLIIVTFVASFIDRVPSCRWVYPFMRIAFFSHWVSFERCFSVQYISWSWLYCVLVHRTVHDPYFVSLELVLSSGVSMGIIFCCGAIIWVFRWKLKYSFNIYNNIIFYRYHSCHI